MIIAGLCIAIAAIFIVRRDFNTAFVIATIGLVAWFLNYRMQMKELTAAGENQQDSNSETEELDGK
jgi:uncharacterized membrane protein YhfC